MGNKLSTDEKHVLERFNADLDTVGCLVVEGKKAEKLQEFKTSYAKYSEAIGVLYKLLSDDILPDRHRDETKEFVWGGIVLFISVVYCERFVYYMLYETFPSCSFSEFVLNRCSVWFHFERYTSFSIYSICLQFPSFLSSSAPRRIAGFCLNPFSLHIAIHFLPFPSPSYNSRPFTSARFSTSCVFDLLLRHDGFPHEFH